MIPLDLEIAQLAHHLRPIFGLVSLWARKCNANASRGGEGTQGAGGDGVKRRVMPGGDVVQQTLQGAVGESISIEGLGALQTLALSCAGAP